MTQITQEQLEALQAAGWTEEEATTFAQAIVTFRDGLPARQRDAFTGILMAAGAAANEDDVQGHLVVRAIIGVLIGMLLPAVQDLPSPGGASAGALSGVSAGRSGGVRQ